MRVLSKNQTPIHTIALSKGNQPKHAAQISHQRTLSPKIGLKGKTKTVPKRQVGGMRGGMGGGMGGGMSGMGGMGLPKGATKQFAPRRIPQMGGPNRVGPQNFRGGNGPRFR
jgi:hypothetical protein